jgi:ectoine hydroxylase-related dioxygenase (phytanoyl-CoA dioxygenase family)
MNTRPLNPLTEQHVADYARDGVVCLRQMFDAEWIDALRDGAEQVAADPLAWGLTGPSHGPMISVSYMWRRPGIFREFALHSPLGEVVGRVIGARTIQLFHDHLFLKPPLSPKKMAWHPDHGWPFRGTMVPNLWTALSPVNAENGRLEFIAGYHRYCQDNGIRYGAAGAGHPFPDFEREIERADFPFKVVSWDLEPGDAVLFHFDTPHYSKGNDSRHQPRTGLAVRVIGDDATWCPVPGLIPIPGLDYLAMREGEHPAPSELLPMIWERETDMHRDV